MLTLFQVVSLNFFAHFGVGLNVFLERLKFYKTPTKQIKQLNLDIALKPN